MFTVSVLGDLATHGAKIIEGSDKRSINGLPVARLGDRVDCPLHGLNAIITITGNMPVTDGKLTACTTAKTVCGAELLVSSQSVQYQQPTDSADPDSYSMEMEDMDAQQQEDYLTEKFGGGAGGRAAAQSYARGSGGKAPSGQEQAVPAENKSVPVGCDGITNETPDSFSLGIFTVGALSSEVYQPSLRHTIPPTTALGHSRAEIICNLRYLVKNTIIPAGNKINSLGYTFKIGSGFRNETNGSNHNLGCAADLHIFKNGQRLYNQSEMTVIAKQVFAVANSKEFLLEFSGSASGGWLHVANMRNPTKHYLNPGYTTTGGRPYFSGWPIF
jgi:uncharacterized Zn-binding protein involved in type VI secretion